jgi:hypothetical protein
MFRGASVGIIFVAAVLSSTPAEARRTAIDSDQQGNTTTLVFSGYCDVDGADCDTTYTLPYSTSFGAGYTNKLLITGEGFLRFVGDETNPSSLRDKFDVLYQYTGNFNDQTSFSGFGLSFDQIGELSFSGNSFTASWFQCPIPSNCHIDEFDAKFTPVDIGGQTGFDISVNGQAPVFLAASFRGLAGGASIPEPSSWGLMLSGFTVAGVALRRRARARATG